MLTIRDAMVGDAAAIAEIFNESIVAGDATMHETLRTAAVIEGEMQALDERESYLVGELAGRVVGWGSIRRYSEKRGYQFCCETSVFLRRSESRKGYGSAIKEAMIKRCRALGYHHLVARIIADNVASIEYKRRLGYEIVGVQREIGFKNGEWKDVAVMQLVLD